MSLTFDMKRAFHMNRNAKVQDEHRPYKYTEGNDSKARHILGLDITRTRPTRDNSTCSTPTGKLRSVTFSDATTAAITPTEVSTSEQVFHNSLNHKSSSPVLRKNHKPELQVPTLKTKLSSSSIRSFYDKSRTPLSVSQQTSDSSSRDFALRKGSPSVISISTPETEHSRQLRLLATSDKKATKGETRFSPSVTKLSTTSSKSSASSLIETSSVANESLTSVPSTARISIYRTVVSKEGVLPSTDSGFPLEQEVSSKAPTIDPARAKINVRRPKAGTKNWFDSLDSDSSDGEGGSPEPQLGDDFALRITNTLPPTSTANIASRRVSSGPGTLRVDVPKEPQTRLSSAPQPSQRTSSLNPNKLYHMPNRKRKPRLFDNIDLTTQSVLYIDCSDDEDEVDQSPVTPQLPTRSQRRSAIMSGPWDHAPIQATPGLAVSSKDSERVLQHYQQQRHSKSSVVPTHEQTITYLDDCSTETITQQEDLLTSFPQTPTGNTSLRGSILSEAESARSTKLINVTRQEETLIAAMRQKKTAMKKAETIAHRQSALMMLERQSMQSPPLPVRHRRSDSLPGIVNPDLLQRGTYVTPRTPAPYHNQRTDSVTTIQTDSVRQQSVRSSIATYLSEGSEDLQLPYSSIHGLPMGSSRGLRVESAPSDRPRRSRDTMLSEMSTTSTYNASPSEWSRSARDSHVVELDPVDRQMLREEIPSQLFMERPFIGWEARGGMQVAL